MAKRNFNITNATQGAAITVKIVPHANKSEFAGLEGDGTLKIRLSSPTLATGQENDVLINFLAGFLNLDPQDIEVVAGLEGRKKLVSMLNIRATDVEQRVQDALKNT